MKVRYVESDMFDILSPKSSSPLEQGMNNLRDSRYVNCSNLNQQNIRPGLSKVQGQLAEKSMSPTNSLGNVGSKNVLNQGPEGGYLTPYLIVQQWCGSESLQGHVLFVCCNALLRKGGYANANMSKSSSTQHEMNRGHPQPRGPSR